MTDSVGVMLMVVAAGTTLFTLLLSGVLIYHWYYFSMDRFVGTIAVSIFVGVTATLLIALYGAAAFAL